MSACRTSGTDVKLRRNHCYFGYGMYTYNMYTNFDVFFEVFFDKFFYEFFLTNFLTIFLMIFLTNFLFLTFLLIKFRMQIKGWCFSCSNSALRPYCPKKYIVGGGVKSAFLNVRISTTYCDIFLFKLPIMECVSLGVCSKVYMENYKWKNKQIARTSWIVRKKNRQIIAYVLQMLQQIIKNFAFKNFQDFFKPITFTLLSSHIFFQFS